MVPKPFSRRRLLLAAAIGAALPLFGRVGRLAAQTNPLSADPMVAAEELSSMEVTELPQVLGVFYSHMHPDAQAIIPRFVVIQWFLQDFQSRAPEQAISTGVSYRDDWAWGVNGVTYPGVAEVSYSQSFGDGSVENDIVRLAPHNGSWTWFFGRSREWVDEQIARFDQRNYVSQDGEAPYNLQFSTPYSRELIQRLPRNVSSGTTYGELVRQDPNYAPLPDYASDQFGYTYKVQNDVYTIAYGLIQTLSPGYAAADALNQIILTAQDGEFFKLRAWNMSPPSGVPWVLFTSMGNHAIGYVETLAICDGTSVLTLSGVTDDIIKTLALEMT